MMPAPITSKPQMYECYQRGHFGNRLRAWAAVDDYLADPFPGLVALREAGKPGGAFRPYLDRDDLCAWVELYAERHGVPRSAWRVSEMAPDEAIVWQGEIARMPGGLYLRYSTAKTHMREALAREQRHLSGLRVNMLLHETLTPNSYDDLMELLDLYDDHVIELSVYDRCLGVLDRRNLLVWEIRLAY